MAAPAGLGDHAVERRAVLVAMADRRGPGTDRCRAARGPSGRRRRAGTTASTIPAGEPRRPSEERRAGLDDAERAVLAEVAALVAPVVRAGVQHDEVRGRRWSKTWARCSKAGYELSSRTRVGVRPCPPDCRSGPGPDRPADPPAHDLVAKSHRRPPSRFDRFGLSAEAGGLALGRGQPGTRRRTRSTPTRSMIGSRVTRAVRPGLDPCCGPGPGQCHPVTS